MSSGSDLALLGVYLALAVVISRLAVDPLRGRPMAQMSSHVVLLSVICAMPEALAPVALGAGDLAVSAVVEVSLVSNLIALVGLSLGEALSGGRVLARAGLDQLLGVVAAAVMTLATAGAVLIESTEPVGDPIGHVLSLGLLVACIVHLKWIAIPLPADRKPNPRAPLGASIPLALASASVVFVMVYLSLGRALAATYPIAALAAVPELVIMWRAARSGRADVGCAALFGGIILDLAAMALVDLAGMQRAAYRLQNPGTMIAIAFVSSAVLAVLGLRLLNEERGGGGQSHSR